jgi:hypothetical protein
MPHEPINTPSIFRHHRDGVNGMCSLRRTNFTTHLAVPGIATAHAHPGAQPFLLSTARFTVRNGHPPRPSQPGKSGVDSERTMLLFAAEIRAGGRPAGSPTRPPPRPSSFAINTGLVTGASCARPRPFAQFVQRRGFPCVGDARFLCGIERRSVTIR